MAGTTEIGTTEIGTTPGEGNQTTATTTQWKIVGEERVYKRYLSVFDRSIEFTAPTGQVGLLPSCDRFAGS